MRRSRSRSASVAIPRDSRSNNSCSSRASLPMCSVTLLSSMLSLLGLWTGTLRRSMARKPSSPACLEQEPDALFGLVDPDLDEARRRHVVALVANTMDLPHADDQRLVVLAQLAQHVQRVDVVGIVVGQTLQAGNVSDRTQSRSTQLAHALGYGIGDRVDLVGLLIEKQMGIAEMRPADVAMKVLVLVIERK